MSCFVGWLLGWFDVACFAGCGTCVAGVFLRQVVIQLLATSPIGKGSGSKQKMYHSCVWITCV